MIGVVRLEDAAFWGLRRFRARRSLSRCIGSNRWHGSCSKMLKACMTEGQFLRQCPRLTSLSLAGSWQLCTAAGLRAITQTWGEGVLVSTSFIPFLHAPENSRACASVLLLCFLPDTLPLELLNLTNCRLKIPSAQALGELLRTAQIFSRCELFA